VATSQIWSVLRDGKDLQPVTEGKYFDHNPVWSPEGRRLFFISDRGGSSDVWCLPLDARGKPAGKPKPVTTGAGVGAIALSEDGTKLAYTKVVEQSNICSMPIVTDRILTLDDGIMLTSENHYIDLLNVSPDGNWIAFDSNRSGNQDIWIMRNDGRDLRQLTTNSAHDWMGSWSPDSKQIAFHSLRSGNRDIYTLPVAGGAVMPLTNHPGEDMIAVWSPDGEEIAFISNRTDTMNLWIVPIEAGKPRQVTFNGAREVVVWSSDSKKIVFSSKRTGNSELYIIPASGGKPDQLTHGSWFEIIPNFWSEDGQTIYASGMRGPEEYGCNLYAFSTMDGSARRLLDISNSMKEPLVLTSDGKRLYFTLWESISDIWMAELSSNE
jgi:TolB protein